MPYLTPSFDEILAGILRDFQNIFPGVDVSQGSLAYMKAAGYASATWGLYQYQNWTINNPSKENAAQFSSKNALHFLINTY